MTSVYDFALVSIGTGATELVHVGQAVLALGAGLDYVLGTVFNYPTLAECYKVAALDAPNKLRAYDPNPPSRRGAPPSERPGVERSSRSPDRSV